jgi:uncharacterized protein YbaR (Trm112 family)
MWNRLKRDLLDILACPIDKYYPLKLIDINSKDDIIIDGVLLCSKCNRYYPIIDEIPVMLPDELRKYNEDLEFLSKWVKELPNEVVYSGQPVHLKK